jgi:hypothetical protein
MIRGSTDGPPTLPSVHRAKDRSRRQRERDLWSRTPVPHRRHRGETRCGKSSLRGLPIRDSLGERRSAGRTQGERSTAAENSLSDPPRQAGGHGVLPGRWLKHHPVTRFRTAEILP